MMKPIKLVLGLVLALSGHWVGALPLTTTGASGSLGNVVGVSLHEVLPTLDTLSSTIQFDSTYLEYAGIALGPAPLDPLDDRIYLEMASSGSTAIVGLSSGSKLLGEYDNGTLFTLLFRIILTGPALYTDVTFACYPYPGTGCMDGEFEAPAPNGPPVLRTARITFDNNIPLPGTLPLIGLGLVALALINRKRSM